MPQKSPLWILTALFLVFFLPILAAWIFVDKGIWPFGRVNQGILFSKPIPLNSLSLKKVDGQPFLWKNNSKKWWVVYITPLPCDAACQDTLYKMHQLRIALNQHQDNLTPVVFTYSPLNSTNAALLKTEAYFVKRDELIQVLPVSATTLAQGYLLIVDPNHLAILGYNQMGTGDGILKDLKRLMRVEDLR